MAADDGVMPQTVEAIDHAKAAGVPMVIVINKIDKPDANIEKIKQQLTEFSIVPEEWGGDTVFVEASAKKRIGLDNFLDMVLLVAEVADLKANPDAPGSGIIIEAKVDIGRGVVATMLVARGTIRVGDAVVAGEASGRVRAMRDFRGEPVTEARPSVPVEIIGFDTVPEAGEVCRVVKDERAARALANKRTNRLRAEELAKQRALTLDDLYARIAEGEVGELNLVVKADVQGSVEALADALQRISHAEVKVNIIHSAVGGITESDVMLATASKAIIIGFNVRPNPPAAALAEAEGVDIRTYRVIYKVTEDIQAALVGLLKPEVVEEVLGQAEVRQLFKVSRLGTIAGCYVTSGKITRASSIRVLRERHRGARRQTGLAQAFQRRHARGARRLRMRHPARRLQRPQGRGHVGGVRDKRSRTWRMTSPVSRCCWPSCTFPDDRSLKAKRQPLTSLRDTVQRRFRASFAEVGYHESWQRAQILVVLAASSGGQARERIDEIERYLFGGNDYEVSRVLVKSVDPVREIWDTDS